MNKPSILVVDDELLIRDLLYDFFTGQGWDISVAEDGEKALAMTRNKKFDLILSDIKMPQMDGLTLSSHVRQSTPEMPIVLMTGYPSVDSAVAALRSKVNDYVIKPFNISHLFKLLESLVQDRRV